MDLEWVVRARFANALGWEDDANLTKEVLAVIPDGDVEGVNLAGFQRGWSDDHWDERVRRDGCCRVDSPRHGREAAGDPDEP